MGCAPHHRALRGASPQGEAYEMRLLNGLYQKTSYAPHHRALRGASPPRGSHEVADNFCRKNEVR